MPDPKKRKPAPLSDIVTGLLKESGLAERVEQASVIPDWPRLVGAQIAAVTEPRLVTGDGTLFVWVSTNAWMTELSLLEPELLRSLNAEAAAVGRAGIRRLRWQLRR